MNPDFGAEAEAFRGEVRAFLADYRDLDGYLHATRVWPRMKKMFQAMGQRGWLALAWPEQHGGGARAPLFEYVLWDEVAYARAARNPIGAGIVARSLLRHGDAAQQARWLEPLRRGDLHFALGYSEPQAGSDLTGLRTRAERDGDDYVVTGEKCWTSYAHCADCLWLLARTGAADSRSRGLSLFVVELASPGVEVRPIPMLDGDQLNEVRLDGVRVPAGNRVGPENGAWSLMADALADERHIQFPAGRLRRDLEEVVDAVRGAGQLEDPLARRVLADLAVEVREAEMLALRVVDAVEKGEARAAADAAANKVFHTELCQRIARAAFELAGSDALLVGARQQELWLQSMWETIGGGTSEIMRGVYARAALGLE